jgi:hypothetical protein
MIKKESLRYNYNWSPTAIPGNDGNTNVSNGHDVLTFINWFFKEHGLMSLHNVERIEWLLQKAPQNYKSRKDLCSYVRKNWDRFPEDGSKKLAGKYIERVGETH